MAAAEAEVLRSQGDPVMMALASLVARSSLQSRLGGQFGGRRDLYETLGYEKNPTFATYWNHYDRSDIAGKIVDLPAQTTWRRRPIVRALEDDDGAFEDQVNELNKAKRLFHYLGRVDKVSGIGHYGVLLIGIKDGRPLEEPLELQGDGAGDLSRLLYLSTFHEDHAEILEFVEDENDPRFGRPFLYRLTFVDHVPRDGASRKTVKRRVHWTRVLHVAEGLVEDDVFGTPRLKKVLNRIEDLQKLTGGSAEMFWQNVAGIWHANLDPDVRVGPEELEKFETRIMEAMHGLRRLIETRGVDLDHLAGEPADPTGAYQMLKQLIAASCSPPIPERILFGSERGQLASDQDQREWHGRIKSRQEEQAEPVILRPAVDFFARVGVLDLPESGYEVEWPSLDEASGKEQAEEAKAWAEAAQAAGRPGTDIVLPPWEFRERFMGMPATPPAPPVDWLDDPDNATATTEEEEE